MSEVRKETIEGMIETYKKELDEILARGSEKLDVHWKCSRIRTIMEIVGDLKYELEHPEQSLLDIVMRRVATGSREKKGEK